MRKQGIHFPQVRRWPVDQDAAAKVLAADAALAQADTVMQKQIAAFIHEELITPTR